MVHLLVIVLGIAAYFGIDLTSDSIVSSFFLPLVFFVAVMYAMMLGVYLVQGRPFGRTSRTDEELRFLAYLSSETSGGNGKGRSHASGGTRNAKMGSESPRL